MKRLSAQEIEFALGSMVVLVAEPRLLHQLFSSLCYNIALLPDTHILQVHHVEAKFLVKVPGVEASGLHKILRPIMFTLL